MEFEQIKQLFGELPLEKKIELFNSLTLAEKDAIAREFVGKSGLTVILGGNNVVANSLASPAFQLNSNGEETSKTLNSLPPEVLAEFLKAIAASLVEQYKNQHPHRKK